MKKISLILCSALMLGACTSEAPIEPAHSTQETNTIIRTEAEAIEIAEDLANVLGGSRAETNSVANVEIIYANGARSHADTLIYAINYADNAGYALISAAKTGESIIGFTDEGNYNAEEAAENPNFAYYMEMAESYVSNQIKSGISIGDTPTPAPKPVVVTGYATRFTTAKWGQNYPEGIYCPNGISGCVQTAMAQILSYFKEPASIALTYPERDADELILDWDNINKHTTSVYNWQQYSHLAECSAIEESHNTIGKLCRELGHRNNATYATNATGAYSYIAIENFKEILPDYTFTGLQPLSSDENAEELSNLFFNEKKGIAYMRGRDVNAGGHAWICEGVKQIKTTTYLFGLDGKLENVEKIENYFYYNWGWNGQDNGYFAAGVFDNTTPTTSRYNFNYYPEYCYIYK